MKEIMDEEVNGLYEYLTSFPRSLYPELC